MVNWPAVIAIIGYQIAVIILLPFYFYHHPPSFSLILITISCYIVTMLGVTAGYHRLYAHKSYKANVFLEALLLFWSTMAIQSPVFKWAHDHRLHHAFVDTNKDPYSIKRGFWHAHLYWMLTKKQTPFNQNVIRDLLKNKLLLFQQKFYRPLIFLTNVLVCTGVGFLLDDFVGSFFFLGLVRIFVTHHSIWFINSLAHSFGKQPHSQEHSAKDNWLAAFLTLGEGYHNYHHSFPRDYRNGVKWYHFDPTKWFIWGCSKISLAYNRLKKEQKLKFN